MQFFQASSSSLFLFPVPPCLFHGAISPDPAHAPYKMLRQVNILTRWNNLVVLALRLSPQHYLKRRFLSDDSDATIGQMGRPQALPLGSQASTLDPATNEDDMLMDSMYYTGYWHDGKTVRVVNWPEWRVERLEWTAPSRPWFNGMALGVLLGPMASGP